MSSSSQKIISGQTSEIIRGSQPITNTPAAGMSSKQLHHSTTNRIFGDNSYNSSSSSSSKQTSSNTKMEYTQPAGMSTRELHSTTTKSVASPQSVTSSSKVISSGHSVDGHCALHKMTSTNQHSSSTSSRFDSSNSHREYSPAAGMSTRDLHSTTTKYVGSPQNVSNQYSSSNKVVSSSHSVDGGQCALHQMSSTSSTGLSSREHHSTSSKIYSSSSPSTQTRYMSPSSSAAIKNRHTTSNISFGDSSSGSNFSSAYKTEYVKTQYKPCPASLIDKNHLKQTRTSKSHKFFLTEE
jgi:hypothetical protein